MSCDCMVHHRVAGRQRGRLYSSVEDRVAYVKEHGGPVSVMSMSCTG